MRARDLPCSFLLIFLMGAPSLVSPKATKHPGLVWKNIKGVVTPYSLQVFS